MGSARLLPARCSATQPSGAGVAAALTPSWGWLRGTPTGTPVLEGPGLPHGKRASAAAQNHVQATGRGAGGSRIAPRRKEGWGEWWPSDGQLATRMGSSPPAACHSSETFGCQPQSLGIGILEPISRDKKHLSSKSGWFLTGLAHGRTTPGPELMLWHPECPPDAQVSEQGGPGSCTEGLVGWQDSKPPRCNQGTSESCSEQRLEHRPQSPSPSVSQKHHSGLPDEHATPKQAVLTQPQSRLCWPRAAMHRAGHRHSAGQASPKAEPQSPQHPNSPAGSAQPFALGTRLEDAGQCKVKLCPSPL